MISKREFFKFWGFTEGNPEDEAAWVAKQEMDKRLENGGIDVHLIATDIAPYKSMVNGEIIEGRKQHKEHLRRHNLVEIGNETKHLKPRENKPDPRLKETIARAVYEKLRY